MQKKIIFLILFLFLFNNCKNNVEPPIQPIVDEKIYVIEDDHIFGGFIDVDNYHKTLVISTSDDTVSVTVESPTPEGLQRESIRSPAFGKYAYFNMDYTKFFNVPEITKAYLTGKPDSTTDKSYFWKNLKLPPQNAIHVPYSNYMGEGEELFIKDFGINNFMGLDVISDYSIKHNQSDSSYLDIEIKQTMTNTTEDTLYMVGIILHIPKVLKTKPNDTKLYNLLSDTVLCKTRYELDNDFGYGEGFGYYRSGGQTISTRKDTLLPKESFNFFFKMTIEPLLEKFEIYPMYLTNIETKGEKIWPGSIITIDGKKYQGDVHYVKFCGLAIPTYILFSINNGELKVVSPDEIEPTFKP